jgi:GrpB-like predicted nucleotidyltransferase (UPF0157 family)
MERYGGGSIVVSDYDPAWPATFEQERTSLHTALGSLVLTVEHIGSTAVPGLAAKPIIDLQLSVHSLADMRPGCQASFSSGRDPGHGHTTSMFCNETIPGGNAAFCFVTTCATIPR